MNSLLVETMQLTAAIQQHTALKSSSLQNYSVKGKEHKVRVKVLLHSAACALTRLRKN